MFDNENNLPFDDQNPENETEYTPAQNNEAPHDEQPQQEQPTYQQNPQQVPPEFAYQHYYTYDGPQQPKKKKGGKGKWIAVAAICVLLGGAVGAVGVGLPIYRMEKSTTTTVKENVPEKESSINYVSTTIDVSRNDEGTQLTPAEIYEKYSDAVVIVSLEGTTTNIWGQVSKMAGTGSGFVLTEDGYILTNYHVVENATKLTVKTDSGDEYLATVVGADEDNDVALIKIDAKGLTTVAIGDSDKVRVGEQVAAIGNPLGELTNTMTVGYLSAKEREVNESQNATPINMMQTDVAINSGNSGGPLFDMRGNVIGITTAKYTGSAIEGLSFAIPINDAMEIVNSILEHGYVTGKPYLGVQIATNASVYGAMISSVEEGGAAERAGLQPNDIITGLGDEKINSYNDLVGALRNFRAGDTTMIEIYRDRSYKTLEITFDERPQETETNQTQSNQATQGTQENPFIGGLPFDGEG